MPEERKTILSASLCKTRIKLNEMLVDSEVFLAKQKKNVFMNIGRSLNKGQVRPIKYRQCESPVITQWPEQP